MNTKKGNEMKHKHAEVIKAFVDGIECEVLCSTTWYEVEKLSEFDFCEIARIKPEQITEDKQYYPEDTFDKKYLYVYNDANRRSTWMSPTFIHETYGWNYMGKVEVIK